MKKGQDFVPKLVVRAFVSYQGKVLLLQRDHNSNIKNPGLWQLPGGGVEAGENLDQAICRELEEEICLVPKTIHFLGELLPRRYLYHAPLSEAEAHKIKKGSEGKDLKFFFLAELSEIPLTDKLKATFAIHRNFFELLVNKKF